MIAAIYARKSTDENGLADGEKSVTRQIANARDYATKKGWTVAGEHIYVDDGVSGAEFANRPGYMRLMNALKPKSPFQALVMSEESRLGRESIEVSFALKQLVTANVRVFCYLTDTERTLDSPIEKRACWRSRRWRTRWSALRRALGTWADLPAPCTVRGRQYVHQPHLRQRLGAGPAVRQRHPGVD